MEISSASKKVRRKCGKDISGRSEKSPRKLLFPIKKPNNPPNLAIGSFWPFCFATISVKKIDIKYQDYQRKDKHLAVKATFSIQIKGLAKFSSSLRLDKNDKTDDWQEKKDI
jgi:hypothetical protein